MFSNFENELYINETVLFWKEFSKQNLKEGSVIPVPIDVIIYDPIHPNHQPISRFKIKQIMKSAAKPILLQCYTTNFVSDMIEGSMLLLKTGDDLRQDLAVLQVFE